MRADSSPRVAALFATFSPPATSGSRPRRDHWRVPSRSTLKARRTKWHKSLGLESSMVDIDPPCFHSVKAIHEGFVRIHGDSLRIVTDRAETLSYLAKQEEYLPRVGFLFTDRSADATHATLVYLDHAEYRLSFDPSSRTL